MAFQNGENAPYTESDVDQCGFLEKEPTQENFSGDRPADEWKGNL